MTCEWASIDPERPCGLNAASDRLGLPLCERHGAWVDAILKRAGKGVTPATPKPAPSGKPKPAPSAPEDSVDQEEEPASEDDSA